MELIQEEINISLVSKSVEAQVLQNDIINSLSNRGNSEENEAYYETLLNEIRLQLLSSNISNIFGKMQLEQGRQVYSEVLDKGENNLKLVKRA